MTMQMSELGRTRGVSNGGIRKNKLLKLPPDMFKGAVLCQLSSLVQRYVSDIICCVHW